MADSASSAHPAVQAQLDRLWALSPGADILGLERITALLGRLGNPEKRLPPVFHVAGTNGKGSTCAFLRAAIEAAGLVCHVYTSPHLVRFNERIRVAGRLIEDAQLASLLAHVLDHAEGIGASFFEVTTAVAFLAFADTPADACIIEVGLGGRLDATNVIPRPLVTGIAQLGVDHQSFLGNTIEEIAGEKAGIAKPGVPLVTMRYPNSVEKRVRLAAREAGAPMAALGDNWLFAVENDHLTYTDAAGTVTTPLPVLAGAHQPENLALAISMLRHQSQLPVPAAAFAEAARSARWPARMQRLAPGPLTRLLPPGSTLWLDGGHNPAAGAAIAHSLVSVGTGPVHVILGMLSNKDVEGLLTPIAPLVASLMAVPVPGHDHHAPAALSAGATALGIATTGHADDVPSALAMLASRSDAPITVLILGSLYLAGIALDANEQPPD